MSDKTYFETGDVGVAAWRAEGQRRFGDRGRDWAFVCPACGNVATCEQVHAAGGHEEAAVTNCIGRYDREQADCDWAAYGLFGNLGKGPRIITGDGDPVQVFAFASPRQEQERG